MATKLIKCLEGFLDSEEGIPIDNSDLRKVVHFNSKNIQAGRVREVIDYIGIKFGISPGRIYFDYANKRKSKVNVYEYILS